MNATDTEKHIGDENFAYVISKWNFSLKQLLVIKECV